MITKKMVNGFRVSLHWFVGCAFWGFVVVFSFAF